MGEIFDGANHKMATIKDDGTVWNLQNVKLGHVAVDGEVFNNANQKVGYVAANGYVYEGTSHIGTVKNTGEVLDYELHHVGIVKGDHIELGGAALLLLVR